MTTKNIFDYSYLAEASYTDFKLLDDKTDLIEGNDKKSEDFAILVTDNYKVKAHWKDEGNLFNDKSGFSGTLFQNKDTGSYVIAMRGTAGGKDIAADAGDIVNDGLAHHQIVDMYNFWQQTKTGEGETYKAANIIDISENISNKILKIFKDKDEAELQNWLGKGYFIDSGTVKKIEFIDSDELYNDKRAIGLGINPSSVVVTGHSLGGHLSAAFSRLFPDDVEHAYMVNGAGFSSEFNLTGYLFSSAPFNIFQVFSALGGAENFDSKKITNIIGDKNIDITAQDWWIGLKQPGAYYELFIESGLKGLGHTVTQMSDGLGIIDLFMRMDKSIATQSIPEIIQSFNPVFKAAAEDDKETLENVVYALDKLYLGESAVKVITDDRGELYKHIKALQDIIKESTNTEIKIITDLSDIATKAADAQSPDGIAYRYALKELNPFVITGLDYENFGNNHINHNTNNDLDIFDSKNAVDGMTDEYILARSEFLKNLVEKNTNSLHIPNEYYEDLKTQSILGEKAYIGHSGAVIPERYIFGDDKNNESELVGGAKKDYLFGGAGSDTLKGGKDNDYLEGGTGHDTYYIEDKDTIYDGDGDGEIILADGSRVNVTFKSDNSINWYSVDANGDKDNQYTAIRRGMDLEVTKGKEVFILKSYLSTINEVTDQVYSSNLGITLDTHHDGYKFVPEKPQWAGVAHRPNIVYGEGHQIYFKGGDKVDFIYGTGDVQNFVNLGKDNDWFIGGDSADFAFGDEGNDILLGGRAYDDTTATHSIVTSFDNDLLAGAEGRDLIAGGIGDDWLMAETQSALDIKENLDTFGDWLAGQKGDDILMGSAAKDILSGGEGADTIKGGAGNDLIIGDGEQVFGYSSKSVPLMHPHAAEWRYDTEKGKFAGEYKTVFPKINPSAFEWKFSVDIETGDYVIDDSKAKRQTDIHKVEEGGGNDVLFGGYGDDLIIGQDGNDYIEGNQGSDILWGDDNRDTSFGGNDTLIGGSGADKLIGGEGYDFYVINIEDIDPLEHDTIVDSDGRGEFIYAKESWSNKLWSKTGDSTWSDGDSHYLRLSDGTLSLLTGEILLAEVEGFNQGDLGFDLTKNTAPESEVVINNQIVKAQTTWLYDLPKNSFVDADGDALTYTASLSDGSALPDWIRIDSATGQLSGTPPTAETLSLTVFADDGSGIKAEQTFTVTVTGVNHSPEASGDLADQTTDAESAWVFDLPANSFSDTDGDTLTYSAALSDGSPLPSWIRVDSATGQLSGTPTHAGDLDIVITATDPEGLSAKQNLSLTVNAINHAPEASGDLADQTTDAESAWVFDLPANSFSDKDGDTLTYSATLSDGASLPSWMRIDSATGQLSGTPIHAGDLDIVITATDPKGLSAKQNVSLTVNAINHAPEASGDLADQTTDAESAWAFDLPANSFSDKDGDTLTYSATLSDGASLPSWMRIDSATGQLSGTPTNAGDLDIVITATDSEGLSAKQTLSLTVNAINHTPELVTQFSDITTQENQAFSIQLPLNNFTDQDGDKLNYTLAVKNGEPLPSWLLFDPNGTLSGTAPTGSEDVELVITASDVGGLTVSDTFIMDVKAQPVETKTPWFGGKVEGGSGDDSLGGSIFNDTLMGNDGDDALNGGLGRDQLFGGTGDDQLNGGLGSDTLTGGTGNDALRGGLGGDTYVFNAGDGKDTITDQGGLFDKLVLNDIKLEDLLLADSGDNWVISFKDSEDQIVIEGANKWWGGRIENFEVNGENLSYNDFASSVHANHLAMENNSAII